jgi:AbrB family looped-hinge helix DNA binding protein
MIEAMVTVDRRGQMVVPKEVRKIIDILGGEKL